MAEAKARKTTAAKQKAALATQTATPAAVSAVDVFAAPTAPQVENVQQQPPEQVGQPDADENAGTVGVAGGEQSGEPIVTEASAAPIPKPAPPHPAADTGKAPPSVKKYVCKEACRFLNRAFEPGDVLPPIPENTAIPSFFDEVVS